MHAFRLAAGVVALAAVLATTAPAIGDAIGTADNDSIRGGPGPDRIAGRAGDDRIAGKSGNDQLRGGPGNDRPLSGGSGRDHMWGGPGNDLLHGQAGRDLIWPGHGADQSRGGGDGDQFFLHVDSSSDQVNCGPGPDTVMYTGQQDAADTLTGCETVWTDVTTPGCVTADEWRLAAPGMRKARVHQIFETWGELAIRRSPEDFGRSYLQCDPRGPHWGCLADLDFLVDSDGVPRLAGKFWASMCWTGQ